MSDYARFRDAILANTRGYFATLQKPNDDMVPCVVLSIRGHIRALPTSDFLRSAGARDLLEKVILPRIVQVLEPEAGAIVHTVWVKTADPALFGLVREDVTAEQLEAARRTYGDIDEVPGLKHERLWTEISDGRQSETWTAPITRSADRPPQLGAWEPWTMDVSAGRFSNVMLHVLAAVRR